MNRIRRSAAYVIVCKWHTGGAGAERNHAALNSDIVPTNLGVY